MEKYLPVTSRPMAWCEPGSDRMCKLRCYTRNGFQVVDLALYRRDLVLSSGEATGTDDAVAFPKYKTEPRRDYRYIEQLQVTILGYTAKKIFAIREHKHL